MYDNDNLPIVYQFYLFTNWRHFCLCLFFSSRDFILEILFSYGLVVGLEEKGILFSKYLIFYLFLHI